MNGEKLKIGIVGITHSHAAPVIRDLIATGLFEIVGIYEPNAKVVEKMKEKVPYKSVADKFIQWDELVKMKKYMDCILIESVSEDLLNNAEMCFNEFRLPMHIDKPLDLDLVRVNSLFDRCKDANIPIQIGYMYRYNNAILSLKNNFHNADRTDDSLYDLGKISYIDISMDVELNEKDRIKDSAYNGGPMFIYGCHLIDLVVKFQGLPENVHFFQNNSNFDDVNCTDEAVAVLEYENGTSIIRTTCVEANGYIRRQMTICGENGTVEIKPLEFTKENNTLYSKMMYAKRGTVKSYDDIGNYVEIELGKHRYLAMMTDFANKVKKYKNMDYDEIVCPVDYEYEKAIHKVLACACGTAVYQCDNIQKAGENI